MDPPRRRDLRIRDRQQRLASVVTTDLGAPADLAASTTDLTGRWNVLDRGVRPLLVRSDGTFTLVDHRDGRTDGRWLCISGTFVSLFVDGPKRHSMYTMPDGQVFLSRYAPPGSASTPELLFRSVLSFEGTWETPFRASQRAPAPPTQMSLGADRTFCAELGHCDGDDSSVLVWSGIWARTDDRTATLDYVAWVVADGARHMASHGQTTLELRDDGTMTVAALDDVFYPAPGTVRAEGDEPLATAAEPDVLLCPLAVDDPPGADQAEPDGTEPHQTEPDGTEPHQTEPDEIAAPAAQARVVEAPSPADRPAVPDVEVAVRPARPPRDAVGTVELDRADLPVHGAPEQRDAASVELPPVGQGDVVTPGATAWRDAATVELLLVDQVDGAARNASARRDAVTSELPPVVEPSAAGSEAVVPGVSPVRGALVDGNGGCGRGVLG